MREKGDSNPSTESRNLEFDFMAQLGRKPQPPVTLPSADADGHGKSIKSSVTSIPVSKTPPASVSALNAIAQRASPRVYLTYERLRNNRRHSARETGEMRGMVWSLILFALFATSVTVCAGYVIVKQLRRQEWTLLAFEAEAKKEFSQLNAKIGERSLELARAMEDTNNRLANFQAKIEATQAEQDAELAKVRQNQDSLERGLASFKRNIRRKESIQVSKMSE
jgi:hypothetical protein